ncbi:MAG: ABC transporter ATP-binding protein [Beijerinckiaceae bacterium]
MSLTIRKGETVGLLGVNGAGKSTLLQLITGTLTPSTGTVNVDGRISALLELGAGFNPDWTGRRNAEFHCIMSGVPSPEVQQRIAAIEEFADIGDFFDQPTRTYSSGMFLRVAFAAAISTNPDILIVDEALAVGDVKFQNKCYRRFEDLQAQGCTVLFVSHAPDLVTRFCTRCIVMSAGAVHFDGAASEGVKHYLNLLYGLDPQEERSDELLDVETQPSVPNLKVGSIADRPTYNVDEIRSGSGKGTLIDAVIMDERNKELFINLVSGRKISIYVAVVINEIFDEIEVGIILRSKDNQILFGTTNILKKFPIKDYELRKPFWVKWEFDVNVIAGYYFIDLGISSMENSVRSPMDWRQSVLHFNVVSSPDTFGIIRSNVTLSRV